ncbi:hypothetical protein NL676_023920 [Syzygium grande]|nr:hypothetical protein NL676_023920 [Syzygium grande]
MDPLSALRDFTTHGDLFKILHVGDEFWFGSDYSFPHATETAYCSKQRNLYTLETLLFSVTHHHLKHTNYFFCTMLQSSFFSKTNRAQLYINYIVPNKRLSSTKIKGF